MSIPELLNRPEGTTAVVTTALAGHAVRLVMDVMGMVSSTTTNGWPAAILVIRPVCRCLSTDLNGDGDVGFSDVVQVLSSQRLAACPEDLTGEGRSTLPIFLKSCPASDLADTFCQRQLLLKNRFDA